MLQKKKSYGVKCITLAKENTVVQLHPKYHAIKQNLVAQMHHSNKQNTCCGAASGGQSYSYFVTPLHKN
jgi:hypothetical protein